MYSSAAAVAVNLVYRHQHSAADGGSSFSSSHISADLETEDNYLVALSSDLKNSLFQKNKHFCIAKFGWTGTLQLDGR